MKYPALFGTGRLTFGATLIGDDDDKAQRSITTSRAGGQKKTVKPTQRKQPGPRPKSSGARFKLRKLMTSGRAAALAVTAFSHPASAQVLPAIPDPMMFEDVGPSGLGMAHTSDFVIFDGKPFVIKQGWTNFRAGVRTLNSAGTAWVDVGPQYLSSSGGADVQIATDGRELFVAWVDQADGSRIRVLRRNPYAPTGWHDTIPSPNANVPPTQISLMIDLEVEEDAVFVRGVLPYDLMKRYNKDANSWDDLIADDPVAMTVNSISDIGIRSGRPFAMTYRMHTGGGGRTQFDTFNDQPARVVSLLDAAGNMKGSGDVEVQNNDTIFAVNRSVKRYDFITHSWTEAGVFPPGYGDFTFGDLEFYGSQAYLARHDRNLGSASPPTITVWRLTLDNDWERLATLPNVADEHLVLEVDRADGTLYLLSGSDRNVRRLVPSSSPTLLAPQASFESVTPGASRAIAKPREVEKPSEIEKPRNIEKPRGRTEPTVKRGADRKER